MRKWILRLVVLAALVVGGVWARLTVFAPEPVEVRVVRVERGRVEATVTNSRAGTVKARRRAKLSPETSGRVVALGALEGERVTAGAVIVRLDDAVQRAQLEAARRALETAEARNRESCVTAAQAKRELDRNRELLADKVISPNVFDRIESEHERAAAGCATAAAMVEEARTAVSLAETELDRTRIVAPFDGILAEVTVEVGEWITPSPPGVPIPSVIDLIDTGSIYVSAPMDEVDSAVIHAGQRVRVTLDPYPDRSFDGSVSRVAPYVLDVEEQNRTVEIEVDLGDRDLAATLLPGTSADVEVVLDVHEGVLRIPTNTLLEGERVLVLPPRDEEAGRRARGGAAPSRRRARSSRTAASRSASRTGTGPR